MRGVQRPRLAEGGAGGGLRRVRWPLLSRGEVHPYSLLCLWNNTIGGTDMTDPSRFYVELIRSKPLLARRPQWRWRAKANNGEVLCHSESYQRRHDALAAVDMLFGDVEIRG
jgi:hypothetical protein